MIKWKPNEIFEEIGVETCPFCHNATPVIGGCISCGASSSSRNEKSEQQEEEAGRTPAVIDNPLITPERNKP